MSGCMHIEYKTIQFYVISGPTKEADSLHGLVTLSTVGVLYSSRQSSMGYKNEPLWPVLLGSSEVCEGLCS